MTDKKIKDIVDSRLGSICVSTELKEKILSNNLVPKKKPILMPAMVAACLCVILAATVLVVTVPRYNTFLSKIGSIFEKQINSTKNITDDNTTDGNTTDSNTTGDNSTKEIRTPVTISIAGQTYPTDKTILDLSSKGLTDIDITQLKLMTNLVGLNLSGNMISDLTSLESLNKLISLDLSSNEITDITPLKSMTKLRQL
ncbi:MAG: hypothetical protein FWC47_05365, partial [Oscillospiraceae bacterium]|nr:hypothetical protein [Oscillospiraceae bacterium]